MSLDVSSFRYLGSFTNTSVSSSFLPHRLYFRGNDPVSIPTAKPSQSVTSGEQKSILKRGLDFLVGLCKVPSWCRGLTQALLKPFKKLGELGPKNLKLVTRLRNAWDMALGFPRQSKILRATAWAGATFVIGLIPPFHALIAAAPITFMTTLLVDWALGFMEGISGDPDAFREMLNLQKNAYRTQ